VEFAVGGVKGGGVPGGGFFVGGVNGGGVPGGGRGVTTGGALVTGDGIGAGAFGLSLNFPLSALPSGVLLGTGASFEKCGGTMAAGGGAEIGGFGTGSGGSTVGSAATCDAMSCVGARLADAASDVAAGSSRGLKRIFGASTESESGSAAVAGSLASGGFAGVPGVGIGGSCPSAERSRGFSRKAGIGGAGSSLIRAEET
jgi:hypothetical protein